MNFEKILVEKNDCDSKNGLIYSSWSITWEKLLLTYPDAQIEVLERIEENGNRLPYFGNDKIGYIVMVKITIPSRNNWTFTERLAIVDFKNQSIIKENDIDSRDICDTIQRCINKVIARVNIGLNVYQNDFSHIPQEKKIQQKPQTQKIDFEVYKQTLLDSKTEKDLKDNFSNAYKVKDAFTQEQMTELVNIKDNLKEELQTKEIQNIL